MTERQLNYLLLAILCFVGIVTLLLAHAAWGQETDWQFMGSAYGTAADPAVSTDDLFSYGD